MKEQNVTLAYKPIEILKQKLHELQEQDTKKCIITYILRNTM